jgi:hypothetical protein
MVRSLLEEVLSNAVVPSPEEFEEQVEDEDETEEVSPHVKARDERVAAIQAEFRRLYPSFGQDVRDLGLTKKKRKNLQKISNVVAVSRRSMRIVALEAVIGESFEEEAGELDDEKAVASATDEISVTGIDDEEAFGSEDACDLEISEAAVGEEVETVDAEDEKSGEEEETGDAGDENSDETEGVAPEDEEIVTGEDGAGDVGALGRFGCLPCSLKCRDKFSLMRHVKLVHEPRRIPVKCPRPWCQAQFFVLTKMLEHKISCLKVCPYCQKTFVREDKFDSHQRYHMVMIRRMED